MPFISQISFVTFRSSSILTGLVLDSSNIKKKHTGFLSTLINIISSYKTPLLKNAPLTIKLGEKEFKTVTNNNGVFSLVLDYTIENEPKVITLFQGKVLEIQQSYPFFFKNSKSQFGVISDIDDTILVSHTASIFKRIGILSFIPPRKRKTIEFTQKLLSLNSLKESNVFYVSKSESNLFNLLSTFIMSNSLPRGTLLLTPYLNYLQLFKGKKGKDFKLKNIQFILRQSINKQFFLFGDDTQKDMEVYRLIADSYHDQIARIYIRQTKNKINNRKQKLWDNLKESFPNSVYFNENTDIEKEFILIKKIIAKQN